MLVRVLKIGPVAFLGLLRSCRLFELLSLDLVLRLKVRDGHESVVHARKSLRRRPRGVGRLCRGVRRVRAGIRGKAEFHDPLRGCSDGRAGETQRPRCLWWPGENACKNAKAFREVALVMEGFRS